MAFVFFFGGGGNEMFKYMNGLIDICYATEVNHVIVSPFYFVTDI